MLELFLRRRAHIYGTVVALDRPQRSREPVAHLQAGQRHALPGRIRRAHASTLLCASAAQLELVGVCALGRLSPCTQQTVPAAGKIALTVMCCACSTQGADTEGSRSITPVQLADTVISSFAVKA